MEKLYALYKLLISFLKRDWELEDYPVRIREQKTNDPNIPRWSAQIINWWALSGLGETKQEAFEDLRESLSAAKELRDRLPRPGTQVPLEFATNHELEKYWDIATRIIEEVLGFDPHGIFVSDGSSLWDFCRDDDLSEYQEKIKSIFGVDVSHIESGNLVELSRYIAKTKPSNSER